MTDEELLDLAQEAAYDAQQGWGVADVLSPSQLTSEAVRAALAVLLEHRALVPKEERRIGLLTTSAPASSWKTLIPKSTPGFTFIGGVESLQSAEDRRIADECATKGEELARAYAATVEDLLKRLDGAGTAVTHCGETRFLNAEGKVLGRVWMDHGEPMQIVVRGELYNEPEAP